MEQLTKNQAVATSQEAVQNQNEPQLRDENAHNDKSVHGVLNPTYQAEIGRASCRERGEISGVAVSLKKKRSRRSRPKASGPALGEPGWGPGAAPPARV